MWLIFYLFFILLGADDGQEHVVEDLDGVDVEQTLLGGHKLEVDRVRQRPHGPRAHDSLDEIALDLGGDLAGRRSRGDPNPCEEN